MIEVIESGTFKRWIRDLRDRAAVARMATSILRGLLLTPRFPQDRNVGISDSDNTSCVSSAWRAMPSFL